MPRRKRQVGTGLTEAGNTLGEIAELIQRNRQQKLDEGAVAHSQSMEKERPGLAKDDSLQQINDTTTEMGVRVNKMMGPMAENVDKSESEWQAWLQSLPPKGRRLIESMANQYLVSDTTGIPPHVDMPEFSATDKWYMNTIISLRTQTDPRTNQPFTNDDIVRILELSPQQAKRYMGFHTDIPQTLDDFVTSWQEQGLSFEEMDINKVADTYRVQPDDVYIAMSQYMHSPREVSKDQWSSVDSNVARLEEKPIMQQDDNNAATLKEQPTTKGVDGVRFKSVPVWTATENGQSTPNSPSEGKFVFPPFPLADHSVNLNAASVQTLTGLPGIDDGLAKSIVEYRDKEKGGEFHGASQKQQLLEVPGMTSDIYNAIEPHIFMGGTANQGGWEIETEDNLPAELFRVPAEQLGRFKGMTALDYYILINRQRGKSIQKEDLLQYGKYVTTKEEAMKTLHEDFGGAGVGGNEGKGNVGEKIRQQRSGVNLPDAEKLSKKKEE